MIAPPRTGWQTLVADLSIILFMVTAGALSRGAPVSPPPPARPSPPPAAPAAAPARADPLAVYREEPGGPTLAQWLARQPVDPRQQLTIVVRYRHGGERAVPARVAALFADAARGTVRTRIVIEPGGGPTTAGLAFDAGS